MIEIIEADFASPAHAEALMALLARYAEDPMGGGQPLPQPTREGLIPALRTRPNAHALLAYVDNIPAGLLIAFEGFSTFQCRPLLNIHDVAVDAPFRGRGLSTRLLAEAEALARRLGCCKLTLEVLEGNAPAKASYRKSGFDGYQLDPAMGRAQFWEKKL
ncbi:GNAT family N-acetyltransferase [Acidihalobacter yilgarnensis]|uniref:GNAT family N-acetyltransferase n=1 Tax=Acidihalobacter yilgarnensis TaxID=2819280 RepID=A0A1D8IRP8_9GAMM|nr:GNAT family N-acetyltransferase [Acidihalobacter yilgarnensis]AOU99218.1 GNAT family N-acetyltransferase [Acidihalobacter yilgarnensis]